MKLLRLCVKGLPLFENELDLQFYAQQRVFEDDQENLYPLNSRFFLNTAVALIGMNASGKTSVLRVIDLALTILKNDPINTAESRSILGGSPEVVFNIYYCDSLQNVVRLETVITSKKQKNGTFRYEITGEQMWEKPLERMKTKKQLTDFSDAEGTVFHRSQEAFLPTDVSSVIARNKKTGDYTEVCSLLSYTDKNELSYSDVISPEIVSFLDPTIEMLYFEQEGLKANIHLKFYGEPEIVLNRAEDLNLYLSSGTIKGIVAFSMAQDILQTGGYLLLDEIENHFNREIVATLVRFFMDSRLNKNGGTLIYSTHYPELLDEYDRNDGIYIIRKNNGITAENLNNILKRNDIKKSDAYQSGFLGGTAPSYEAYCKLRKMLEASVNREDRCG